MVGGVEISGGGNDTGEGDKPFAESELPLTMNDTLKYFSEIILETLLYSPVLLIASTTATEKPYCPGSSGPSSREVEWVVITVVLYPEVTFTT